VYLEVPVAQSQSTDRRASGSADQPDDTPSPGDDDDDDDDQDQGPPEAAMTVGVDCDDELCQALTGCGFNDHHWVFAASATDVGFELTVRDTASGAVRKYWKEPGSPAPAMIDAAAFPESCRNEN